jgi:hypothetical protein
MHEPLFFIALAHTDAIAYRLPDRTCDLRIGRMSILHLFPKSMRQSVLFSASYPAEIHFQENCDNTSLLSTFKVDISNPSSDFINMFADCGAFQYRNLETPIDTNGELVTADSVWAKYSSKHLVMHSEIFEKILLCSPDHIVSPEHSEEEVVSRLEYCRSNSIRFLELSSSHKKVIPVAVIHGQSNEQRLIEYEYYKQQGFKYIALGGMVPYSTKREKVLDIIAGVIDIENPLISENSILASCRRDGIKIHIFGLNSPEWVRWWYRLKIDSFDGSKLSTEGAANGWYWMAKICDNPRTATDLYDRINVKKMTLSPWKWIPGIISQPIVPVNEKNIDTNCNCIACVYLSNSCCVGKKCNLRKDELGFNGVNGHASDPRMMGSREHNMGRVVHNSYVYESIINQIRDLIVKANSDDSDEGEWLNNWKYIEVS